MGTGRVQRRGEPGRLLAGFAVPNEPDPDRLMVAAPVQRLPS
jgi:hypothetical protein